MGMRTDAGQASSMRAARSWLGTLVCAAILGACGGGETPPSTHAALATPAAHAQAFGVATGHGSVAGILPASWRTMAPAATSLVRIAAQLDSRLFAADDPFDPEDAATFNKVHSVPLYDAAGNELYIAFYFQSQGSAVPWRVHALVNGVAVISPEGAPLAFGPDGECVQGCEPYTVDVPTVPLWLGGMSQPIPGLTIDFSGSHLAASNFAVTLSEQNGWPRGQLEAIAVSPAGVVTLRYDNGQSRIGRKLRRMASNTTLD